LVFSDMEEAVVDLIRQDYLISVEYALFMRKRRSGVYCIPTVANSMEWAGVMFIRVGVFQGAIFRFRVYLPDDENGVPSFRFENDVYHPAVDRKTGELDTSLLYSQCSVLLQLGGQASRVSCDQFCPRNIRPQRLAFQELHLWRNLSPVLYNLAFASTNFHVVAFAHVTRATRGIFCKSEKLRFSKSRSNFRLVIQRRRAQHSLYALEPSNPRTVEAIYFQLQPVYTLRQDSGNFVQQAATSLKSVRQ
ncbi:Protein crossbronx, partial [Trichinella pseudospiralis]